eukprot:5439109-Pyramimonas_sp.AAC.1
MATYMPSPMAIIHSFALKSSKACHYHHAARRALVFYADFDVEDLPVYTGARVAALLEQVRLSPGRGTPKEVSSPDD